ncbi:DUF4089 domain-containing protein [Hwanghaeella sp.]|uniref:DUF4089 domain-containing protein n=1 Tax=Hwanghaeella sp. TaxID=2605943 RepID=UPI003CCC41CB
MTNSKEVFDPNAYIRATAPTLGLDLNEERVAEVSVFLSIAKGMADVMDTASIPENSLELGPVYDAGQAIKQTKTG